MVEQVVRESGKGESARPTPAGDFDGTTRVDAMRALLAGHKADRKERLLRRLRRPLIERIGAALTVGTLFQGIIWTGPKLTPQEAADVLRPNQTVVACECFHGPYVASTGSEVSQLVSDYRAALLRRATESLSLAGPHGQEAFRALHHVVGGPFPGRARPLSGTYPTVPFHLGGLPEPRVVR